MIETSPSKKIGHYIYYLNDNIGTGSYGKVFKGIDQYTN